MTVRFTGYCCEYIPTWFNLKVKENKMNNDESKQLHVDSTSDNRVINNVMRHEYKVLSENDKIHMRTIKDIGLEFFELLDSIQQETETSRELSIAKTKVEEAVMWAVKHITK